MALTVSKFIYGFEVFSSGDSQNNKLDFIDNGMTFAATIPAGVYTPAELAAAVQTAMRTANTDNNDNTCTYSFSTDKFTLTGTATFSLLWSSGANAGDDISGMLGFDESGDNTSATTYTSDSAVGGTHSEASTWTMQLPHIPATTPYTANADGTAASGPMQREVVAAHHVTDGGLDESLYTTTRKYVELGFDELDTTDQAAMESFLDWVEQGKRFNWLPDSTSTEALRLVLPPASARPVFSYMTASEVSYGTLRFLESLSRT